MSWSQGLREWAELGEELTDEEIAEQEEGDADLVIFTNQTWKTDVYPVAAQLLDLLEDEGPAAVFAYLDHERIDYLIPKKRRN